MSANALLISMVIVLGMTPVGLIPLGFINITVLCIPVIVGTLALGLKSGLLLGFSFATVSMLSMLGLSLTAPSGLAQALFVRDAKLAIIMCYAPRLLMPAIVHFLRTRIIRNDGICAFIGSFSNTVLYLGLMLLFYYITGLQADKILKLIFGTGIIAGTAEAVFALIIVPLVLRALSKLRLIGENR